MTRHYQANVLYCFSDLLIFVWCLLSRSLPSMSVHMCSQSRTLSAGPPYRCWLTVLLFSGRLSTVDSARPALEYVDCFRHRHYTSFSILYIAVSDTSPKKNNDLHLLGYPQCQDYHISLPKDLDRRWSLYLSGCPSTKTVATEINASLVTCMVFFRVDIFSVYGIGDSFCGIVGLILP